MAGDSDSQLDNQAENEHVVRQPFLIGVAGGTASGKSSVCGKIMELLGQNKIDHHQRQVVILSQDSFYRVLTSEQKTKALKGQFNFDHPDAFDNELIVKTLCDIMEGRTVQIPVYDFVTHSRKEETVTVYPADVVLFEGILMFYSQEIRDLFQMKLFVDTDADTRLSRRVLRDISERGRDLEQVLNQYITFVKPAFEEFCLPQEKELLEKQQIQREIDEALSKDWLKENSKPCPSCGANIQKELGCNKMTCSSCQQYFCWICLAVLNRNDPYRHFKDSNCPCYDQ